MSEFPKLRERCLSQFDAIPAPLARGFDDALGQNRALLFRRRLVGEGAAGFVENVDEPARARKVEVAELAGNSVRH